MNIHLIKTPEYLIDDYTQVTELLRSFNGPMQFLSQIGLAQSEGAFEQDDMVNPYRVFNPEKRKVRLEKEIEYPLDWSDLFGFCKDYRDRNAIRPDDFVVLLTQRRNTRNWFAMFDGNNNAFVDCKDWEYFTDSPSKYPIAYEVIAVVFRTLMKPKLTLPSPYFHDKAKGCMNDLCVNKIDISLKLRTADVCPICISRLNEQNIDDRILDQGIRIFEGIRLQLLFREGSRRPRQISEIKLTNNNKLYFTDYGNLELKLFPLQKVLYAFYLNHLEGVKLNELTDHKAELLYWYRKFSNADTNEEINIRIDDLINPLGTSFRQKKSSLNNKIKALLGEKLAQYYKIEGESGEQFKINLTANQVNVPEDRSNSYA